MSYVEFSAIEELGVQGCLYLGALLTGQQRRIRVAPTVRSTLVVLNKLRELKLIQVPWPETRWGVRPDAEITPIENLQWALNWNAYERAGLLATLEEFLEDLPQNEQMRCAVLQIWDDLAQWETEQFFEYQLTKHQFDAAWVGDFGFVLRRPQWRMPIARWRYCFWAAVRHGAAIAQRQKMADSPRIRDAIYRELERRISYAIGMSPENGMFLPFDRSPSSAISDLLINRIANLGDRYWTAYRYPSDLNGGADPRR
jgi:hypothetical protein